MRKNKELIRAVMAATLISSVALSSMTSINAYATTPNEKDNKDISLKKETNQEMIEKIRLRWKDDLTGGKNIDVNNPVIAKKISGYENQTNKLIKTLNTDKTKDYLWIEDKEYKTNPAKITAMLNNILSMSMAYSLPNNKYYHNKDLKDKIIYSLDWINENAYNDKIDQYGNWWDWMIGIPARLDNIVILMYDDLSEKQVKSYMDAIQKFLPKIVPGSKYHTGANLADVCINKLLQGVISKDPDKIKEASDSIVSVFDYVTSGDGFYPDGSYVQHGIIAYTGSYGAVLINKVSNIMYLLEETPWSVKSKNKNNIYKWVFESFDPIVSRGYVMDMVCGRSISRPKDNGFSKTSGIIEGMMKLSMISDKETSKKILSLVKQWANESNGVIDFGTKLKSINSINKFYSMMQDNNIQPMKQGEHNYQLNMMDKTVHERENYSLAISRSSNRISKYEFMNKENLRPWFQGDGMTYLYNSDITQYSDDFWPTIDPYRLPGTTIDTKKREDKEIIPGVDPGSTEQDKVYYELSNSNYSGGTSLGKYGVAAMKIDNKNDKLKANKSWFMFDNEIVCLGSGISDTDSTNVETVIENRKLKKDGSNSFVVDGKAEVSNFGDKNQVKNAKWAYLEGNNSSSNIGYYFPKGEDINVLRDKRVGNWLDINKGTSSEDKKVTGNYLTMYVDHGNNIANKEYSYVILPGKSKDQVEGYAKNPKVEILRNDDKVSAVKEKDLNIEAANFFVDGKNTAGDITSNKKASIIMKEGKDGTLNIAVSDPTFTGDKISVEVNKKGSKLISKDPNISNVKFEDDKIKFDVDTNGAKGKSYNLAVKLDDNKSKPVDENNTVLPEKENSKLENKETSTTPKKEENKVSQEDKNLKEGNKVTDNKNSENQKEDPEKSEVKVESISQTSSKQKEEPKEDKGIPKTGYESIGLLASGIASVVLGTRFLKKNRKK